MWGERRTIEDEEPIILKSHQSAKTILTAKGGTLPRTNTLLAISKALACLLYRILHMQHIVIGGCHENNDLYQCAEQSQTTD